MPGLHRDQLPDILARIDHFNHVAGPLPGLLTEERRRCWAEQIISSLRRISYIQELVHKPVAPARCDPHGPIFDPIRGALHFLRSGELDEAVWLTFIQTHFGKNEADGWKLAGNVYGSFGDGPAWTFAEYGNTPHAFEAMLANNADALADRATAGAFSNHRKYESRKPGKISEVFRTFYAWHTAQGSFEDKIRSIHSQVGQEPGAAFDAFYNSMVDVSRFGGGRLGRFDLLTMIGKLQLAPITPPSVYLIGASGPLRGAKLLFFGDPEYRISDRALQGRVDALDQHLHVGKQVIEDSICNWQKSPDAYVYFRG